MSQPTNEDDLSPVASVYAIAEPEVTSVAVASSAVAPEEVNVQSVSYTIVEDHAEAIVDLDSRYSDAPRQEAVAYSVATVEHEQHVVGVAGAVVETARACTRAAVAEPVAACTSPYSTTATASSPYATTSSYTTVETASSPYAAASPSATATASPLEYSTPYAVASASPYATAQASPVAASPLSTPAPMAFATSAQASSYGFEESKEEITHLAGLQTGRAASHTIPATVIGSSENDDEEMARMKRAAAYGGPSSTDLHIPSREPQPEPLPGEDFADFYSRTIDHWNILAAEQLSGSGVDLNMDSLEDESTKMASKRWQIMQPSMNVEGTVVEVSEGGAHPSELGAVEADFVRQDFTHPGEATLPTPTTYVGGSTAEMLGTVAMAVTDENDDTTEATVIDSAPLAKEEGQESWQATEEAQVLENITAISPEERKPAASGSSNPPDEYTVAYQEGVVLAIEDDIHPSELAATGTDAEVVGTDFSYSPRATSADTGDVVVGVEAVASAVLVATATSVGSANHHELQTVSVLPTESISVAESEDDFLSSPVKDVPWSGQPTSHADSDDGATNSGGDDATSPDESPESPLPPAQAAFADTPRDQSTTSGNSNSERSTSSHLQNISSNIVRSTGTVMDVLFGDHKGPFPGRKSRATETHIMASVSPRILLPWSVIFSPTNKMWVATLQTSQKALDSNDITEASKALRAFSLPTEKQALSLAQSWTPPRMLPFAENPECHICRSKFAVFKRKSHCRNCGVCVCANDTVQWPNSMVPDTFNTKTEGSITACRSCDSLSNAFRLALLRGNMDEAVAIHATGNLNVTCPFSNVKGECFYPVHAAVMGGSLPLLKWLVDSQCCPIKSVRVTGKSTAVAGRYTPIVTSKGRSLLGIAMEHCYDQIVRYLVVKKGIVIAGERDVTNEMLTRNLTRVLRMLPEGPSSADDADDLILNDHEFAAVHSEPTIPEPDGNNTRSLSDGARDFGAIYQHAHSGTGGEDRTDECIICFDAKIDCVCTPCGHQICCLQCSTHISRCPVCAQENCSFMRVFKP